MIDSKGSVVVSGQGSAHGVGVVVVVPDHGGQREDALGDPGGHAGDGTAAVTLETELVLRGVEHGLDDLPDGLEQRRPGPGFLTCNQAELVTAGRSYLGGPSAATAPATVARAIPNCFAIARCDNPSLRCSRLISAQSSNEITRPIVVRWPSFRPARMA